MRIYRHDDAARWSVIWFGRGPEEDPRCEIEAAFHTYLRTYFTERDLEGTLELLGPEMTGFGTALDERGDGIEDSRRLYARDIEQAPNPIDYRILFLEVTMLGSVVGLVRAVFDLSTTILKQAVKLRNARMSAVMMKRGNRWYLEHKHLSLPTDAHGETESYPVKELEERTVVLERLVRGRTRELREARDRLQQQADTDALTGISNRLKADHLLEEEFARISRYGGTISVILLDVDFFKAINDNLGHRTGDGVLRSVASLLAAGVRDTDTVARWGGEEFLVLCPSTSLNAAVDLAERLRHNLAHYEFGIDRAVRASFGVAEFRPSDSRETLVERADEAMYRAKNAGRDRVEVG